jgi:hypothetical protein
LLKLSDNDTFKTAVIVYIIVNIANPSKERCKRTLFR